jgi:hypothetical protein
MIPSAKSLAAFYGQHIARLLDYTEDRLVSGRVSANSTYGLGAFCPKTTVGARGYLLHYLGQGFCKLDLEGRLA